jgi:predicted dehydrogenase
MPLRVGLLGLGDAGRHHRRAIEACPEVVWTALGARDPSKAPVVPADVAVVSTDELLAGGCCDAIVIATPDALHVEHARRALAGGHHVLVEKPLATTARDAAAIVEAAGDRVVAVGYQLRHHVAHELVRARLGELVGAPRAIGIRWAWPDPAVDGWRARGERARWWSLAALGTHAIDLALWLVGDEVADIAAVREPPRGIDRAAEVVLRFAGGALAHVSCAVTHRATSRLVVAGELGEIEALGTLGARGGGELVHRTRDGAAPIPFAAEDPYLRQLRAFAARCAGAEPRVDRDAIANVRLLESISPS